MANRFFLLAVRDCPHLIMVHFVHCCTDVDCVVSSWGSWSSCSKTCGSGTQSRSRSITTQQSGGGAACPTLTSTQSCNTQCCRMLGPRDANQGAQRGVLKGSPSLRDGDGAAVVHGWQKHPMPHELRPPRFLFLHDPPQKNVRLWYRLQGFGAPLLVRNPLPLVPTEREIAPACLVDMPNPFDVRCVLSHGGGGREGCLQGG